MTLLFVGCWQSAAGLLGVGTVVDDEDVSALPFTNYFTDGLNVQCIVVASSDSLPHCYYGAKRFRHYER